MCCNTECNIVICYPYHRFFMKSSAISLARHGIVNLFNIFVWKDLSSFILYLFTNYNFKPIGGGSERSNSFLSHTFLCQTYCVLIRVFRQRFIVHIPQEKRIISMSCISTGSHQHRHRLEIVGVTNGQ